MKRPSASQVRATWENTVNPSARKIAEAMTAQGFTIDQRTVTRYKKAKWAEPKVIKKAGQALVVAKKAVAKKAVAKKEVEPAEADPHIVGRRLARMQELYERTLAENQATLQQTGLIASIIVAEEMVAMIEVLTIASPGDVARLLHAITEATQVKHVGGAGQVPESDDPRVIDGTVNQSTEVRDAVNSFRKSAGL